MLPSQNFTISIDRKAPELYEKFWKPETFPSWASGLASASLKHDETGWSFQAPDGPVRITFTPHNDFLIMDHTVHLGEGKPDVFVPMRIVPNGEGSEVILTLFRQKDMDDKKYERDANWVKKDLAVLKKLAESS